MAKQIRQLLHHLPTSDWQIIGADVAVNSMQLDSRLVENGCLFFALQGENFSANQFIQQAIANGAVAIACDRQDEDKIKPLLDANATLVSVKNIKQHISVLADVFFDNPSSKLNVIAVTGTDGKTSTSHFMAQCLPNAAIIGTLGMGDISSDKAMTESTHTTPDAIQLQHMLSQFVSQGVQHVAMEASSHGLHQHRLDGVAIDVAMFTNFSRDHLDYHKTEAEYKAAKLRLFNDFTVKHVVTNIDDAVGSDIFHKNSEQSTNTVTAYTLDSGKVNQSNTVVFSINKVMSSGYVIDVNYQKSRAQLSLNLLGKFNVLNAAGVFAVLLQYFSFESACKKIQNLQPVVGRMQHMPVHDFNVVIDYAHTPNALQSAIEAVQEHAKGNVICVFGCGGDRDQGKRPLMAKAALQANFIIVTSDNPRTENPQEIVEQVIVGFSTNSNYQVEIDRKQAIYLALNNAQADDVVLIAGKGHEDYQIIGDKKHSFSDVAVVNQYIQDAA